MTEEESLAFWGDLAPHIASMLNALAFKGQLPMINVLRAVLQHAEERATAASAEREECAKVCESLIREDQNIRSAALKMAAEKIRARET
jgi:hypothetical protein